MPPPPKKGKGKGKDKDAPTRKTRCPVVKENGVYKLTYEWKDIPKLYTLGRIRPAIKAIRQVKDLLASEQGPMLSKNEAIQYAVERGDMYVCEVLIQAGLTLEDYKYKPPLTEEQLTYLVKKREAERAAAEEAEGGKKK